MLRDSMPSTCSPIKRLTSRYVRSDHEMRCAIDGGQGGSVHALREERVDALHRRMTCSAPKHEGWDFDCGERCCRQREIIRTTPSQEC